MFKILSTYIVEKIYIKCNSWRVAVRPSYIQDARFFKVNMKRLCELWFINNSNPLQAWTGCEGSRRLRLPYFKTIVT